MNSVYQKRAFYLIGGLTLFRLIYIFFLPLIPQEAYYWYYAQYPALSYFDHPPMAAYSIWLGTHLFGDTAFGVKFMAVIWGALTNLFLFLTIRRTAAHLGKAEPAKLAFYGVVLYNLTVFAYLYCMLIVPDTPLLFFWMLSLYFFQEALLSEKGIYWIYTGIAMGLGFISKYTIVGLLPAFFFVLLLKKDLRHHLRSPWPYLGFILMLVLMIPVVYWNYEHHWASFGFQFSERAAHVKRFQTKYIFQLIGSQMALLTPLLFVLLIALFAKIKTLYQNHFWIFNLFFSGLFIILGFTLISLRSLVKMNWLLPGYLGVIAAAALLYTPNMQLNSVWKKIGVYFSVFLILVAHLLQIIPNVPIAEGNTWSGWQDASQKIYRLQQEFGGQKKCFIFANSYKSASLLKFYLPDQQNTYAQNIYGRPALQFDIWGTPDSLQGKDALYVFTDRREYKNDLKYIRPYFESVEPLKEFEYTFNGKIHVRTIYCYYAKNYRLAQK